VAGGPPAHLRRLRTFVDLNPHFEDAIERLASFLARDDADDLD
jgi:hypothetical protein